MSLAYGIPLPKLQRMITLRHFNELFIFATHETLDPQGWRQNAEAIRWAQGFGKGQGQTLDPAEKFLPTEPWPESD